MCFCNSYAGSDGKADASDDDDFHEPCFFVGPIPRYGKEREKFVGCELVFGLVWPSLSSVAVLRMSNLNCVVLCSFVRLLLSRPTVCRNNNK